MVIDPLKSTLGVRRSKTRSRNSKQCVLNAVKVYYDATSGKVKIIDKSANFTSGAIVEHSIVPKFSLPGKPKRNNRIFSVPSVFTDINVNLPSVHNEDIGKTKIESPSMELDQKKRTAKKKEIEKEPKKNARVAEKTSQIAKNNLLEDSDTPKKYDVFISSKSEDYPIAEQVYDFLLSNGLTVFLASRELEVIAEDDYAEAIDDALDESHHMIVVGTRIEYIESKWVKFEWQTFCNDLKSQYREGKLFTILGDAVEKRSLPASIRHKESFTLQNYQTKLLSYLAEDIAQ